MANEKKTESKKPGFFSKIGGFFAKLGEKFKGLKSEWKKVSWASPRATFKNFALVLVVVICFAIAIALIDVLAGLGVSGITSLFHTWFGEDINISLQ
ncbi:MAG: preprotein translocase subunit SecE [Clostridia bacterium]|nr:preprotein translocase subunit SecE [Clostridia bacterium]